GNPQPSVTEYENGDPSAWAEDVNSGSSVEKEYAGGAVKRNDIGFPEFRDDTWNHAGTRPWGKGGQYDNAKLAATQRKAEACERVARALLRTTDEKMIEETALDLMNLPSKSLVATLKRMDQTSPASLPENARFRRALACTKLSALILSEQAEENAIERLASLFNSLDDVTLKSILNVVASARVAAEEGEDEGDKEPNGDKKDDDNKKEPPKEEKPVLTDADLEAIKEVVQEVEAAEEAAEEAGENGEEGVEDLQQLFEGGEEGEGAPAAPAAPGAPPVDITFDEGEPEGKPAMASDLSGLFDTEDSLAQRELTAAQKTSFGQRTASSKGAKKLGQVQAPKASVDENLESLWERPGQ
ncbi:MAG TPA: hypothetical protein PLI95_23645, partial [Polyangiaceae bacterium]|nr:hypothetical protein [Polyangiaceae bacterium]